MFCKGPIGLGEAAVNPAPVADGFCFAEGPRWFGGRLWFSDMLGEAVHTVTPRGAVTTLPLPGHAPSGLGFSPEGNLLIVSTERRQLLGHDGRRLSVLADVSDVAPASLGDMVVDVHGRAYVGAQARECGVIIRVDPDSSHRVVATDLDFPNGMVITPDGTTLIVAESTGRRLTALDIDADGGLGGRRVFADALDAPPDGIALDADGAVWAAMTLGRRFDRIARGGALSARIDIDPRTAIACALGGPDRRTLFLVSSTGAYPQRLVGTKLSRLDAVRVDVPGAGRP